MKCLLIFLMLILPAFAERRIEVFVALCDNVHQGIARVPAKIGNGVDYQNNLYWGNSEGFAGYFKRSKKWKLSETIKPKEGKILVTLKFKHHTGKATLTAHAYRGDRIETCLEDFFVKAREAGKGDLVAFIGHNAMMDSIVTIPTAAPKGDEASDAIVLACVTEKYFTKPLAALNSDPVLLTRSLMYPGSFLLHDALEVWLKDGSKSQIREAAVRAYAKNQGISTKGARTVFSNPGKE